MRVKKFFSYGVVLLASSLLVISTSCKKEDDDENGNGNDNGTTETNVMKVGGNSYDLGMMFYEDSWGGDGASAINIYLAAPGTTAENSQSFHGHDYYIMLSLVFPEPQISGGTFVFSDDNTSNTFSELTLVNVGGQMGTYHYANGGSIQISVEGSTYTVAGDLSVEPGPSASFHFQGPAVKFD